MLPFPFLRDDDDVNDDDDFLVWLSYSLRHVLAHSSAVGGRRVVVVVLVSSPSPRVVVVPTIAQQREGPPCIGESGGCYVGLLVLLP